MILVVKKPYYRDSRLLLYPGDELAPGLLAQTEIDQLLDAGVLVEVKGRLSYFALLPDFAGVPRSINTEVRDSFPQFAIPQNVKVKP